MNSMLSFWSIYEQVKRDFIKDVKKYFIIFSLQGSILFFLYLLPFFLLPKDILVAIIQEKRSFALGRDFRQQFDPFSVFFVLLITIFSYIIPFMFHVGLLNFIYTLKTKSISLSIQEFFRQITIKKAVRVFFIYAILSFLLGMLFLVFALPIILFSLFNISTTALITLLAFIFLLFLIFPTITLLVRFFIAPFVIFESDATVFNAIQQSFNRTKGQSIQMLLIWIVSSLIALIAGFILLSPFLLLFGYSFNNLFLGKQISFFMRTYLEKGYTVIATLILFGYVLFSYTFKTFWSIIFFLINGEMYKRLSKKQENQPAPFNNVNTEK